jgi:hypothetical protein
MVRKRRQHYLSRIESLMVDNHIAAIVYETDKEQKWIRITDTSFHCDN